MGLFINYPALNGFSSVTPLSSSLHSRALVHHSSHPEIFPISFSGLYPYRLNTYKTYINYNSWLYFLIFSVINNLDQNDLHIGTLY